MCVYLLHFSEPYRHARHYIGYATNLDRRLAQHRAGTGARLLEVIDQAGITWELARVWDGGRDLERHLKNWHKARQLCPICRAQALTLANVRMVPFPDLVDQAGGA